MQLGFMFARHASAVRLCLLPMTYPDTLAFLRTVAWPGDHAGLAVAIAPYSLFCDGFGVHLNVADDVSPSLGIELLYDGKAYDRQPSDEPRWSELFERLIADGLCTKHERDALLEWESRTSFEAPLIERLIAGALPSDELLLHGTLHTGLQHVKLSFDAQGRAGAKVYYGATFDPEPNRWAE